MVRQSDLGLGSRRLRHHRADRKQVAPVAGGWDALELGQQLEMQSGVRTGGIHAVLGPLGMYDGMELAERLRLPRDGAGVASSAGTAGVCQRSGSRRRRARAGEDDGPVSITLS